MESNKHNDELIKRKLADLNAEPRKLNFATVHANYEKAKETSSNKWGIYAIIGAVAIAVLVTTYALLMPNSDNTVAQTNPVASTQPTNDANTITSVGTSTEDRFAERSNSENLTNNATSTEETSVNNGGNNSSSANESAMSSENSSLKNETAATGESSVNENNTVTLNKVDSRFGKNVPTNETKIVSKIEKNTNTSNKTDSKSATNKTERKFETNAPTNDERKKEELASNTKSSDNVPITRSGSSRGIEQKKKSSGTKKDSQIEKELLANNSDNNQSSNKGGENLKSEDANNSNSETIAGNANNNSNSSTADKRSENNSQNSNTTSNEQAKNITETAKVDSTSNQNELATKVDTASADAQIPGIIGTGSVSPRNKHKWLVGAEVSYNSIAYNAKENPNSPALFSTGDPAFSTAYANAVGKGKHSLITGAISLGYLYNEKIGVTAGLSYFNVKNTFSVGTTSTPVYTTALDYYVWSYVMDSVLNTLTYKIVDTVYKQVPSGNTKTAGTTVNGDSVSTATFENNLRYVSIPLNLSYNFKLGAKFSIEPQAGIVYTMPLRSNHLVATDAYAFNYSKQKTDLRKNLYFNTALKLGYNISNKMQVYVRGGYFFRNQSVYTADQPIIMSLKSIYTSFGMTFRIK